MFNNRKTITQLKKENELFQDKILNLMSDKNELDFQVAHFKKRMERYKRMLDKYMKLNCDLKQELERYKQQDNKLKSYVKECEDQI